MTDREENLLVALNSPLLKNCSTQVIVAVISKGMVLLGIRDSAAPSRELMQLLVDECKNFHGSCTLQELSLCFEMAARGQLECEVNPYQNFSVLYFNQLMGAYKRWAANVRKTLPDTEVKEGFTPYIYEPRSVNYYRWSIQMGYEDFLRGGLNCREWIPYDWYKVLCDDGFIEFEEEIYPKNNVRYGELPTRLKAGLVRMQEQVFALFELAKGKNAKAIYVRE